MSRAEKINGTLSRAVDTDLSVTVVGYMCNVNGAGRLADDDDGDQKEFRAK